MDSTAYYKSFAHTSGIIQMLSNHFNIHTLYTANKAFGEYVSDVVRVNDRNENIELFKIYVRQYFKHIGTATTLLNFKDILGDKYEELFDAEGMLWYPMSQYDVRSALRLSKQKCVDLEKYGFIVDASYFKAFVIINGTIKLSYMVKATLGTHTTFKANNLCISLKPYPRVVGHVPIKYYNDKVEDCEALFMYEGVARTAGEIKMLTGWSKHYLKRRLKSLIQVREGEVRITS